jgi:phosphoserine phosphatase
VTDILAQDLPLAVISDATFGPAHSLTLAPGDVLALITDGFVEWTRPGQNEKQEQFGLERLRESLKRHVKLPAKTMIEAVAMDVALFAGGEPQQDDLTMVIIKRVM